MANTDWMLLGSWPHPVLYTLYRYHITLITQGGHFYHSYFVHKETETELSQFSKLFRL